ncbi:MAG: hypothetical protein K2N38_07140 [Oscillospiraceae bacterium]|nr:hypothetical protein [Oscillospiraceae bacterium]
MRITNPTILRGYNRDLNRLLNLKTQTEKRITSQRQFARASEAPLAAAKALNVRKSLYYSAQYKENLKVADKFYTEAETSLLQVSEKMAQIRETIIAACNTTKDMQDYNIYAQQLETSARELCSIFNTDSAGRAIFGGESDDPSPFEIINDSNGNAATVLYHGIPVNAMSDYKQYPYSKEVNLDIGLGMEIDQETQEVDPQSVLNISFVGTKVSGCGAEYGVADIDLSQIKENRMYCIDVYAGNVKKTIAFKGQVLPEDNVKVLNAALADAYKREKGLGEGYPKVDAQGVVYLVKDELDADDNVVNAEVPVEDGIVCIVNNEYRNEVDKYTEMKDGEPTVIVAKELDELKKVNKKQIKIYPEKLVVDNDSGYTNKFKVNVDNLEDGEYYSLEVKVGNEDAKTITFQASDNDDPELRTAETLNNIQQALDEAYGTAGKVNISKTKVTQGMITCEGSPVKVSCIDNKGTPPTAVKADIISKSTSKFDTSKFETGKTYTFTVPNGVNITVKVDDNTNDIVDKFNNANNTYTMDTNGVITKKADGSFAGGVTCKDETGATVPVGAKTDYSINLGKMIPGAKYELKVITDDGRNVKNISFEAGENAEETLANLEAALNDNTVKFTKGDEDGVYNVNEGTALANTIYPSKENPIVERESIYSNNYIQLTLDAARALRNGDIAYANGCIDRIVTANENLLVEIADLGCNEEFISFNLDRITTREENLLDRQNDLEGADVKKEITLWKTYEAMYNACLQMSSSVVPNSIFNYIK